MNPKRQKIEALVARESRRIAVLFANGQEESALIRSTRLVERIDSHPYGAGMREIAFGIIPQAFHGSHRWARELYPRWRCEYRGTVVVLRARSRHQAQFEAAQVLLDLSDIETEPVVDGRQLVPSYV